MFIIKTYQKNYSKFYIFVNIQTLNSMNSNPTKRIPKGISPLAERNITPDYNKYLAKDQLDTIGQSNIHPSSLKQFEESPLSTDYARRRKQVKEEDFDGWNKTLAQLNLQLDNNMNEIIFLLGKRKNLINQKKKRLREQMQQRLEKVTVLKENKELNQYQFANDADFLKITSFCENPKSAVKILSKIMHSLPDLNNNLNRQNVKSDSFWNKNRTIQNNIDEMLVNLRQVDKNLQFTNNQVIDICRSLDGIEDSLKAFIGNKTSQKIDKVQSLFNAKNQNYQHLNQKIKEREQIKDSKINYIKRIKDLLNILKKLREDRIEDICGIFGSENLYQLQRLNSGKEQGDFTSAFQQLLKLKQKDSYLQTNQKQAWNQIEVLFKQQEQLYNQILRKQSDEAKAFHSYTKVMNQRIKYNSIMKVFGLEDNKNLKSSVLSSNREMPSNQQYSKQLLKKFKDHKALMKKYLQQNALIKQGLVKTNQTTRTFETILRTTQNEKQRRQQLLRLLEDCIKRRVQYEKKKEQLRNLSIEQAKNEKQKTQFEEELQIVLSEGDINSYKKVGNALQNCQTNYLQMARMKKILETEMESMDKEVVSYASRIQEQYEDILCEIIPSDYQYSLRNGQDVKRIRNYLRKMYKRLGILKNQ